MLKFSMCCGGTVIEFNTKKDGIPLRDVPCFHFRDEVCKHLLTCQAPTLHWGIAQPCHCTWGWRKDQGQSLSVLEDCSIGSTARRKVVSLLYCRTTYSGLPEDGAHNAPKHVGARWHTNMWLFECIFLAFLSPPDFNMINPKVFL
jgi:hypothetical protein